MPELSDLSPCMLWGLGKETQTLEQMLKDTCYKGLSPDSFVGLGDPAHAELPGDAQL